MAAVQQLLRAFAADRQGAIALNTGLLLIPVMITLSFVLDRTHI